MLGSTPWLANAVEKKTESLCSAWDLALREERSRPSSALSV